MTDLLTIEKKLNYVNAYMYKLLLIDISI